MRLARDPLRHIIASNTPVPVSVVFGSFHFTVDHSNTNTHTHARAHAHTQTRAHPRTHTHAHGHILTHGLTHRTDTHPDTGRTTSLLIQINQTHSPLVESSSRSPTTFAHCQNSEKNVDPCTLTT